MTSIRGLLALLALTAGAAEIRAQVILVPNPYVGGSGIYYSHSGRHSALSLSLGGYYYGPYLGAPPGYNAINQVTVVYTPQALDPELRADPPGRRQEQAPDPRLPGGRDAGVFRPLAPDNRDRAVRPAPPEPPEPPLP